MLVERSMKMSLDLHGLVFVDTGNDRKDRHMSLVSWRGIKTNEKAVEVQRESGGDGENHATQRRPRKLVRCDRPRSSKKSGRQCHTESP